ncbi:adhesion G protein-coupled receptor A3 [Thrips palmi]|uniref:Adhesion G protein-coupled receptor A3 n=1 Tax=Thrips palmi TaxID=161013 RepID=A0A6P8Z1B0_THRPL|nr:adhesion G protein-coupled receptor A3 [Thrips palmi]
MNLLQRVGFILVLAACLGLALSLQPAHERPSGCPTSCNCTKVKNGSFLKVRCSDKLDVLSKLDLSALAPQIAHLDLSRSTIVDVGSGYFLNFTNLKRLDLSFNKIEVLQDHAFDGLSNLEVLKLSNNNLARINRAILENLMHLQKFDIGNNFLDCDCAQSWLFEWARNFSGKKLTLTCASPVQARGLPLLQWYNGSISMCTSNVLSLDILKIQPQQDQVVFEGDRLRLQCQASLVGLDSPSISWFWGKQDPAVAFKDVHLGSVNVSDNGTLVSALIIDQLSTNHSGQWNCLLVSGQANHSRTVSVIVISAKTKYCPQIVTRNNKGVYVWPQTVVGFSAELPCEATDFDNIQEQHAYHACDSEGKWHSLNTSLCPYSSRTTRLLQDFLRMNLSEDHGPAIVESAQQLLNLSCGTPHLSDKMDAIFLSKAISNYVKFLPKYKEMGSLLVDMVSCITQMPRSLLRAAQLEERASSKLVHAVETVTQYSSPLQSQRGTLAVEEFHVSRESFLGLTCVWYSVSDESGSIGPAGARPSQISHCSEGNNTSFMSSRAKASVQIPPTLFFQLERQGEQVQRSHQLLISMYENSHLFPQVNFNESHDRWDVVSSVIGAKLVGLDVRNLAEPLYIAVRAPAVHEAGGWARPVWWDEDLNAGAGGWSKQGCALSHLMHGKLVFNCDRFGYFGLLQEMPYEFEQRVPRSILQLAHPAIYIGSLILILSLIIAIVTYVVAGPHIQMPKRTKHALINTWIAIALLSFMFSIGVHQTDDVELCQSVGMILHYLTLCALLWMAVTVSNMRSSLNKKHPLEMGSEDDLPSSSTPPPKPLLGLYLVGWGIGLMVVGVSGAVNLKQYRYLVRDEYCFLVPNSALGAVLVPCAAVVVYLLVCVLLVRCDLSQRQADTNAQLSDGTQGTENVDLDLLDCTGPARPGIGAYSVASTVSSEVEDAEHTPATQLRATLIVLLLFVLLWTAGALATANQLHTLLPQAELVFSVLYAVTASLMAVFILFFHCFARSDVRPCWLIRCRGRHVSDTRTSEPPPPAPAATDKPVAEIPATDKISNADRSIISQANGHGPLSNRVSSTNSINSNKSRNQRAAVELNKASAKPTPGSPQGSQKDSNLHLMPVYRSYPNVVDAEMFYNPRQSDMARKFFRKQKRQAMCSQNQDFRRRGDGQGNQSDMESTLRDSLKGSGSKVSNTNIHVEQRANDTSPSHAHSFNILISEGPNTSNQERWVIGADSPPPVNNDGTVRSAISSDGTHTPGKLFDRNSRRRRSRGVRDVSGSHDMAREKYQSFTQNGTMSSLSSIQSRDVEMDGDFMRVSVLEEAPTSVALQKTPVYPWDNSSVISGASFSLDRVSEIENDVCSMSRSSRRSSRSPSSRKRYRRPDPSSLRSHPTSLASSIVSLQNKDAHVASYPAVSEVSSTNGVEDTTALSKKETCV